MTTEQKAIALFGLIQLSIEYLEEVMSDGRFSPVFVRELKRDANNFIKTGDKFISYVSSGGDMEVKEQIVGVYTVVSKLVENHIEWNEKETQTT